MAEAPENDLWVLDPTDEKMLTLVTCFPFHALVPGGLERYVVRAIATD
jgi:sortase A